MSMIADTGSGYGFNIIDERGRPVVSFVYETLDEANAAAEDARSLIKNAISVRGNYGR
jgi:hypothetical protein